MNTTELVSRIEETLRGVTELDVVYLFGSAARGMATPISDVDVAILPEPEVGADGRGNLLRALVTELEHALPGCRVQVVFFDELPIALRGRVVTEGILVIDRDPPRRVAAEVQTRMLYHDFLPFERQGAREGLRVLRETRRDG